MLMAEDEEVDVTPRDLANPFIQLNTVVVSQTPLATRRIPRLGLETRYPHPRAHFRRHQFHTDAYLFSTPPGLPIIPIAPIDVTIEIDAVILREQTPSQIALHLAIPAFVGIVLSIHAVQLAGRIHEELHER